MLKVAKDVFQIPLMPRNSINCYLVDDVIIGAGIRSSSKKIINAVQHSYISAHAVTYAHADQNDINGN